MRGRLAQKTVRLDRPVLVLLVAVNIVVLAKLQLQQDTFIGLVNGSLSGALLVTSFWRFEAYALSRQGPIILLRLLVAVLPLVSDTVGHFNRGYEAADDSPSAAWQLGHAAFMLLVGISWAAGLFLATFLLLPPAHHLAVQVASLAMLLSNNRRVCQHFLDQHPSNAAVIDAADAGLRALVMSTAPAVQHEMAELGGRATQQASCMAGAAAMQVSLGLVLPTMLAWQLQSRMAASIAALAQAQPDASLMEQVQRSQHFTLCARLARYTQGCTTKLLLTGASMLITYIACLRILAG